MISFIVTYRDRSAQLADYIKMLDCFYNKNEYEVVISEQKNNGIFMQGQLFNLAYSFSRSDIIVLMDIDIRFTKPVDFYRHMRALNHPFMGYNKILNCTSDGTILEVRKHSNISHGGCCVFTRKQFEDSSGFSNLMFGWGGEDDIVNIRIGKYNRITNTLLHIEHPRRTNYSGYSGNVVMYRSDKQRKKELDGFRQTKADLIKKTVTDNIVHLEFDNIGVVEDFMYKELLGGE